MMNKILLLNLYVTMQKAQLCTFWPLDVSFIVTRIFNLALLATDILQVIKICQQAKNHFISHHFARYSETCVSNSMENRFTRLASRLPCVYSIKRT